MQAGGAPTDFESDQLKVGLRGGGGVRRRGGEGEKEGAGREVVESSGEREERG